MLSNREWLSVLAVYVLFTVASGMAIMAVMFVGFSVGRTFGWW